MPKYGFEKVVICTLSELFGSCIGSGCIFFLTLSKLFRSCIGSLCIFFYPKRPLFLCIVISKGWSIAHKLGVFLLKYDVLLRFERVIIDYFVGQKTSILDFFEVVLVFIGKRLSIDIGFERANFGFSFRFKRLISEL